MLTAKVRHLFVVAGVTLGCASLAAHLHTYDTVALTFYVLACTSLMLGLGMTLIIKARALDGFVDLTNGLDAFYADPNQSDLNKQLITNYAVDHLEAHINRLKTANPLKDEQ